MLNRWIGILSILAMLLATGAVVWRDIVPNWFVGDPPITSETLQAGEQRFTQVGIYHADGRNMGHSFTHSRKTGAGSFVIITTETVLEPIYMPGGVRTPRVLIRTELNYRESDTHIDEVQFHMHGLGVPISLRGEAMPSGEFPCQWQVGTERGYVVLDSQAPAVLGDAIRPFNRLPNLYVGRSWELDIVNPLTQIIPGLESTGLNLEPVRIEVIDRETIEHHGQLVSTYVVEGGGARAWVADDGTVLRQEVVLPLLGRLVLVDEPYDPDLRNEVVRSVPTLQRDARSSQENPNLD